MIKMVGHGFFLLCSQFLKCFIKINFLVLKVPLKSPKKSFRFRKMSAQSTTASIIEFYRVYAYVKRGNVYIKALLTKK